MPTKENLMEKINQLPAILLQEVDDLIDFIKLKRRIFLLGGDLKDYKAFMEIREHKEGKIQLLKAEILSKPYLLEMLPQKTEIQESSGVWAL